LRQPAAARWRARRHVGAVVEAVDLPAVADTFAQQGQAQRLCDLIAVRGHTTGPGG
jgi:hypothetical protein